MNRPTKRGSIPVDHDILGLLRQRETKENMSQSLKHRLHVTESFIHRLVLEKELEGHTGCVNCLEWNETGRILASASDDLHVILWDPFAHKNLKAIHTGHHGNIFSVKFMPKSDDNILVTGAGDSRVRVHDVKAGETTHVCNCHSGRVKRIATAPNVPFLFWSAAEDGSVIQTDLRAPHVCAKDAPNLLVNLVDHLGRHAEAKCLSINPRRPELLAVGANDPYVRVYDRRMMKLTSRRAQQQSRRGEASRSREQDKPEEPPVGDDDTNKIPQGCVQYFVAGHLPVRSPDVKKRFKSLACTYLTFGADGSELLVNLGGEQIYLFDINNRRGPKTFAVATESDASFAGALRLDTGSAPRCKVVSERHASTADKLRIKANEAFEKKNYTLAISLYNLALAASPDDAVLFGNRAAGYLMRMWDGDVYSALRDCLEAIRRDQGHCKAHLRLVRCLLELRWLNEADRCLAYFKSVFPLNANDDTCVRLAKDIKKAQKSRTVAKPERDTDDESSSAEDEHTTRPASTQEDMWRANAYDYEVRFCGHCNTTTDIKECNFFGSDNQFVVAGSDDGSFFIWDRHTTNIVRILKGDESIVNCLQPHPSTCVLATSGIDPVVRLWSPGPEDGSLNEREVSDRDKAALANQKRMNADPFEIMLLNMGMPQSSDIGSGDSPIQCRPS